MYLFKWQQIIVTYKSMIKNYNCWDIWAVDTSNQTIMYYKTCVILFKKNCIYMQMHRLDTIIIYLNYIQYICLMDIVYIYDNI